MTSIHITLCSHHQTFKYWRVVLSDVFSWICPKHNTLYSGQGELLFHFFLQYYFSTWLLVIHPQFSPITAIKLSNCFKVTIGLMVKSLSGFLPLRQLSQEGRLYLCSDWVYWYTIQNLINSFTNAQRDIQGLLFYFYQIGVLLCKALENLSGLCGWICA